EAAGESATAAAEAAGDAAEAPAETPGGVGGDAGETADAVAPGGVAAEPGPRAGREAPAAAAGPRAEGGAPAAAAETETLPPRGRRQTQAQGQRAGQSAVLQRTVHRSLLPPEKDRLGRTRTSEATGYSTERAGPANLRRLPPVPLLRRAAGAWLRTWPRVYY